MKAITFTLLTVGGADPVAEGSMESESAGQLFPFTLRWDQRPELQVEFAPEYYQILTPTQRERNELRSFILRKYIHILLRALYGSIEPYPRTVLSANFKTLRLGHGLTCKAVAGRLDVQHWTVSRMEDNSFDFEADIWKYVDPADSLLFRGAAVYHVPRNAVWELSSPYFFIRHRIERWSYDFGSKPFNARVFPFERLSTENSAYRLTLIPDSDFG